MSPLTKDKIVGLPVRDALGREIGKVVCYVKDGRELISKVIVLSPLGEVKELTRENLEISPTEVRILDELIINVRSLRREMEVNFKRMKALEELNKSSPLHKRVYSELKQELEKERENLEAKKKELMELANQRRVELARKLIDIQKVKALVEVQVMAGEIDDVSYRLASSEIKTAMDKLSYEMNLLNKELSFLEIEISETPASRIVEAQQTANGSLEEKKAIAVNQQETQKQEVEPIAVTITSETNSQNFNENKETDPVKLGSETFDFEFIKKIGGVIPGFSSQNETQGKVKEEQKSIYVKVDV